MQSAVEVLHHEAASLNGLVDFISAHIQEREATHTYLDSTKSFFAHIRGLATKTKSDLHKAVQNAQIKPDRVQRYRPAVTIFAGWWTTLHTFVKPATDAHTLSVPGPLIDFAERRLKAISGFEDCNIVVLLTPELMYFQNEVRRTDKLPQNTAFVEVPYSQGPNFFTNLVIFHEIGHFVFSGGLARPGPARSVLKTLMSKIDAVMSKIDAVMRTQPALAGRELGGKTWARARLVAWTQEMFSDLFALQLIGPAFSFAIIDLLTLAALMRGDTEIVFDRDHPAPAFRMKEHRALLSENGWWEEISSLQAEHVALIERLSAKVKHDYRLKVGDKPQRSRLVAAFVDEVMPLIRSAVTKITKGVAASVDDFHLSRPKIQECLANGIVPSALIKRPLLTPTPCSIINAAYCFYLTELPGLMSKVGQELHKRRAIGDRNDWAQKIEAWALKSLEDYELVRGARASKEGARPKAQNGRGVFSLEELLDRLNKRPGDTAGLVIAPLLNRKDVFDADSIDLRLGSHFLLPKAVQRPFFSPDESTATSLHTRVHVPFGGYLVVPAHQTVLGATLEFIKLPYDASGQILTKSSVARTFIVVETAPWIHPEYRGCLTLEIANVSNTPVLLYPGRPIGQLVLLHVVRSPTPDGQLKSSYFGPVYPEAPQFKNPQEALREIGVRRTKIWREDVVPRRRFSGSIKLLGPPK